MVVPIANSKLKFSLLLHHHLLLLPLASNSILAFACNTASEVTSGIINRTEPTLKA
jgi:hypothetical protein